MSALRRHGGPDPAPAQAVTGSVVIGDVIQLYNVGGEALGTIIPQMRPPYSVHDGATPAQSLSVAVARAQPSRLLLPRYRVVPFTGRERELDGLRAWAQGEAMSVRLVHAAGGQGKTRLADQFATGCAAEGWAIWRVGHPGTPSPPIGLPSGGRALVLVDYADRWPISHLVALIGDLHNLAEQAALTLRVLLLARSAGFWWPAVTDLLDSRFGAPADDTPLSPLAAEADRGDLYATAAAHFAAALDLPDQGDWPAPNGLDGAGFAQVLAVHMAALATVDARLHGATGPSQPHAISAYLLRREFSHWHNLHARAEHPLPTPPQILQRVAYLATLTGALPRPKARSVLTRAQLAAGPPDADRLIDDHRTCYPAGDETTVLEPMHPDRLGEDLIALATPGHGLAGADVALLRDDWTLTATARLLALGPDGTAPEWTPAALTTLVEAAHRWPHVAREVLYPLLNRRPRLAIAAKGVVLNRLAALPDVDLRVLARIDELLPANRHIDFDTAAATISMLLTHRRLAATADPARRARLHVKHALRLANAGHTEAALAAAEAAVEIYRHLAESRDVSSGLAQALHYCGTLLDRLNRHEEAVAPAEEAVAIYRRLADAGSPTGLVDVALALNNLGICYSAVGRREEALRAVTEARDLADRIADGGQRDWALAMSSTNMGILFNEIDGEEALAAALEAVRLHRRMARRNRASLMDLGYSLHNLAARLHALERHEEAFATIQEAVALRRTLAEANPEAGLTKLALSLRLHSQILTALKRHDEALASAVECVSIRRKLTELHPAMHRQELIDSLGRLDACLVALGRHAEALLPLEEVVALRRQHAEHDPARLPDLAAALNALGLRLARLGRCAEALTRTEECVAIRRRLAEHDAARLPALADALIDLGNRLGDLARYQESLTVTREAAELLRELGAAAHPRAYAATLNNLGLRLGDLGRHQEALAPAEEAVAVRRRLAADDPRNRRGLALALNNLHVRLTALGRHEQALAVIEEAVRIRREVAEAEAADSLADLAQSLRNLSSCLRRLGRCEEALRHSAEAVRLGRLIHRAGEVRNRPDLAWALNTRALALSRADRWAEALTAAEESVALLRALDTDQPTRRLSLAEALETLARCLSRLDRHREALAALEEGIAIARSLGAVARLAYLLASYAHWCARAGEHRRSAAAAAESIGLFERVRLPFAADDFPRQSLVEALDAIGEHGDAADLRRRLAALSSAG